MSFFFLVMPRVMYDLSSPIGDRTQVPALEAWSLNHWITREGPGLIPFKITLVAIKELILLKNQLGNQVNKRTSPAQQPISLRAPGNIRCVSF